MSRGRFSKVCVALKRAVFFGSVVSRLLTTESVESPTLPLQSIDNIHGSYCLSLGMLSVCDCISDHVLEENFQNSSGFFVDQPRNSLHTTPTSKTANSWLGDTLDIIAQNFSVTLCASFSKTFSSFSTSRHVCVCC